MMVHLRIVVVPERAAKVTELLTASPAVCNLTHVPGAASKPDGDLVLCDVAREAASIVIEDLEDLDVHRDGSIAITPVDTMISSAAEEADRMSPGDPSNAVVWEQVSELTAESSVITVSYMLFMALACIIAATGIFQDSPILIVGAMILGPEFGPLAGFCVAFVTKRVDGMMRSGMALVVGFPLGITAAFLVSLIFRATDVAPETFKLSDHFLADTISSPNVYSVAVALCAGVAGILSLTTAKSSTLLGVLVSVTTIPAAANIAVAAAYGDGESWVGSMEQLVINLVCLVVAGIATLKCQRWIFERRRRAHLAEMAARAPSSG